MRQVVGLSGIATSSNMDTRLARMQSLYNTTPSVGKQAIVNEFINTIHGLSSSVLTKDLAQYLYNANQWIANRLEFSSASPVMQQKLYDASITLQGILNAPEPSPEPTQPAPPTTEVVEENNVTVTSSMLPKILMGVGISAGTGLVMLIINKLIKP